MTTAKTPSVKSPCISVCYLDDDDICTGCYRSAEEITDWMDLDDDGKRIVLQMAAQRFRESDKSGLL